MPILGYTDIAERSAGRPANPEAGFLRLWTDSSGHLKYVDESGNVTDLGSSLLLQTDGTNNGSQSKLNLVAGPNVTLTDDGLGGVRITAASVAGGSGGTTGYPDCQPNNPQTVGGASDDEFTAASLDAAWTLTVAGATTLYNSSFATSAIAAKLTAQGSTNNPLAAGVRLQKSFVPGSADFQVTIKCHVPNDAIGHGCYLYLMQEAVWQNGLRFAVEPQNGTSIFNFSYIASGTWHFSVTTASNFSGQNGFEGTVLLHIQRKSGAFYFFVSHDGAQWTTVASNRTDIAPTINYVGLGMEEWNTGQTPAVPNRWLLIDWVRFNWIDLLS